MDRRSLHKSRMESETLRRQETSSYLAMRLSKNTKNHNDDDNYDEDTKYIIIIIFIIRIFVLLQ